MKKFIASLIGFTVALQTTAFAQDTKEIVSEVAQAYGVGGSKDGLIAGFSMPALIGGLIFSSIGFGVFIYGKKNSEVKPLLIGIALMGYPYFIRATLMVYLVGMGLCAMLYLLRD